MKTDGLRRRACRLVRLIDLDAPASIIATEVRLITHKCHSELVEDALRRINEAVKDEKPTCTLFRCNVEALRDEILMLREKVKEQDAR